MKNKTIRIRVDGGVASIINMDKGVTVEFLDFDINDNIYQKCRVEECEYTGDRHTHTINRSQEII